ncbi:hypothetical protein MAE02_51440 [Microvirga aerophila]|uniref:Uncharacterized protein n=1 Tax=Microvirga aerophila TaxID=670291 RepID=A0A512BZS0_9HYPH|nr:hypothetical protein MAE02_51440 [Microvirga aerophila]
MTQQARFRRTRNHPIRADENRERGGVGVKNWSGFGLHIDDVVDPEGHTGEVSWAPAKPGWIDPEIMGTDEQLECFRQSHVPSDRNLRASGRDIPDLAMDHGICPNDDLCLLKHAKTARPAQVQSFGARSLGSNRSHADTR